MSLDVYNGYDGSTAYEAFKKDAQVHEAREGFTCKIPWSEFEELPPAIRARWAAVEAAVCKRYGAIY